MKRTTDIRWAPAPERADLDIVASHLAARRRCRRLTRATAGIAAVLVAAVLASSLTAAIPTPGSATRVPDGGELQDRPR
jgi:hypothetical protein